MKGNKRLNTRLSGWMPVKATTSVAPLRGYLRLDLRMATGTVKWFNPEKGYGFVAPDGGGQDVFVHISAVEQAGMRSLNEGQKIHYEVVADKRSGKSSASNLQAA